MSDFREYSAAFMDHQNDLMHYGVKGMKWHDHKRTGAVQIGKNGERCPIVGPDIKGMGNKAVQEFRKEGFENFTEKDLRYISKPMKGLSDNALDKRLVSKVFNKHSDKYIRKADLGNEVAELNLEGARIQKEMERRKIQKRLETRKNRK